jgi:hypothetical protein
VIAVPIECIEQASGSTAAMTAINGTDENLPAELLA